MKFIEMTLRNDDGQIIEKQVEERLVSTYKSMGWEIKEEKEKPKEVQINSFIKPKKEIK